MKAVVDDKIPFIREAIEQIADEVVYLPGRQIGPDDVRDADVLVVRTRTRCNRRLLEGSRVQFVATATIGFDHIDTDYLKQAGIAWSNCPGCNANSVAQYIHASLLLLKRDAGMDLRRTTLGIVGVGHVGEAVRRAVTPLGVRILLNDPPREEKEGRQLPDGTVFAPLEQLQQECDILSLHTPLVTEGAHPTYHLADEAFLMNLTRHPVLINSGRGEVVDNEALLRALDEGAVGRAIIDTWENEPHISLPLLYKVYIGTPHIAGYSADGKANATRMTLQAICRHFGIERQFRIEPPALPPDFVPASDPEERALQLYNPLDDSRRLKANPQRFEDLRGNYPMHSEFA